MNLDPRIKEIRIAVPGYEYFHAPSDNHNLDPKFLGRERQIDDFVETIRSSNSYKGKYLISGERGIGKKVFRLNRQQNLRQLLLLYVFI